MKPPILQSPTISVEPPSNPGLDYLALRQRGIHRVQALAGDIWTDYNEHDPGVTILEQLCYALTELSYRAELPVADMLARSDGSIDTERHALFTPARVLPGGAVTANDYRKLIVDQVPGVANCWMTPWRKPVSGRPVNGLYHMQLLVPALGASACTCGGAPEGEPVTAERIIERAERLYAANRNLCEDLHSVTILTETPATVHGTISIAPGPQPETVLARVLFAVEQVLAPELRRTSLRDMLATGLTPSQLFTGPLPENGFVDDAMLRPRAELVPVRNIIRAMAAVDGVIGVREVTVRANGETYGADRAVEVRENTVLRLDTKPGVSGYTLVMSCSGRRCSIRGPRVDRELDRLRAEIRRTYPLSGQLDLLLPPPRGEARPLDDYVSIQDQFPNAYGINIWGLPRDADTARRAKAKQLKGYLLVFEQLMADFMAQIAHVKDLFAIDAGPGATRFCQSLASVVPEVAPLLGSDYEIRLQRLVRSMDDAALRRSRFLDLLLALQGQEVGASRAVEACCGGDSEDGGESGLLARQALARILISSTRDRARGADMLALATPSNIPGLLLKCRVQLGMESGRRRALSDTLRELGIELAEDQEGEDDPQALGDKLVSGSFIPVSAVARDVSARDDRMAPRLRLTAVDEAFLQSAVDISNYRLGLLPGDKAMALVCRQPDTGRWRLIGRYPDIAMALAAARAMVELARSVGPSSRKLAVVEHVLLRFGRDTMAPGGICASCGGPLPNCGCQASKSQANKPKPEEGDDFPRDFTLTALVSAEPDDDRTRMRQIHGVIRENTPSHIALTTCFLPPAQMTKFEELERTWRDCLRAGKPRPLITAAEKLRGFLAGVRAARATVTG